MDDMIATLRAVPLFSSLKDKELQAILEISKEVALEAGHTIVEQDGSAIGFHLLLEGQADIEISGRHVSTFGPGDYFGEVSLLDGKPRTATVITKTPTRALVIPSWSFNTLLDMHPAIAKELLLMLCARLRSAESLITA
ncbi:MAG: cyclic nucleotide-binding domain-containing protein [Actinomycetota bacterium]